jgi:alkylhydroperoxidase family enzyme
VTAAASGGQGLAVRVPPAPRCSLHPLAGLVATVTGWATRGDPPRVFSTLGRHPRLFRSWLRFSTTLLLRGDLPPAERELAILRTAWLCRSWYEWAQHGALASHAGLDAQDVERVMEGPDARGWWPRHRLVLAATDELHDRRVVTDATWRALSAELTDRQLIELCLLVGHYEMLAMTLNSLGVEPEPTSLAKLHGGGAEGAERLRVGLMAARGTEVSEAIGSTAPRTRP